MQVVNPSDEKKARAFAAIKAHIEKAAKPAFTLYAQLGSQRLRLVSYAEGFRYHIETQLAAVLCDDTNGYDSTLVLWQEKDMEKLFRSLVGVHDEKTYRALRYLHMTQKKRPFQHVSYCDDSIAYGTPFIFASAASQVCNAYDPKNTTYYYGVEDLSIEAFMHKGHAFVKTLYDIIKKPTASLVHGAVIGVNNTGVLFCGTGHRGKSTLTVNALLHGFDYIADDYLLLEQHGNELFSYPLYSIITLSDQSYDRMKGRLNVAYVSKNSRKDKDVYSISAYHQQFATKYPVKLCIYLRFTDDIEPRITMGDKDIAVRELVFSTLRQVGDTQDVPSIAKLYGFVEKLPFYCLHLTKDIDKNTQFLQHFLENFAKEEGKS